MNKLSEKQRREERFIKWAESRDDDWWNEAVTIWDYRIFDDFLADELVRERGGIYSEMYKKFGGKQTTPKAIAMYLQKLCLPELLTQKRGR